MPVHGCICKQGRQYCYEIQWHFKSAYYPVVISLFLGNPFDPGNAGRLLETGFMMTLQPLIKTKLDRKKLEKEISFIQHEDLVGVLLNGFNHIHGRINVSKE